MPEPKKLLARLDQIGQALASTGQALALIGLGSVGTETARLDEYSDLDFFAIVKPGQKLHFIEDLSWLESAKPLAYTFRNTPDGYKALFVDGIFCEFAVFEEHELEMIPFAEGRIIWKEQGVSETMHTPAHPTKPTQPSSAEWLVGEALTNLYIGLGRWRRGEKLSGSRFIEGYAVDRLVELAGLLETERPTNADPFNRERRFEQRFPEISKELPAFMQGYERTPESAQEILAFLDRHFEVNDALKAEILRLISPGSKENDA